MRHTLALALALLLAVCGPIETDHGECEPVQLTCHEDGRLWICPNETLAEWWDDADSGYWHRTECGGGCAEYEDGAECWHSDEYVCRYEWDGEGWRARCGFERD